MRRLLWFVAGAAIGMMAGSLLMVRGCSENSEQSERSDTVCVTDTVRDTVRVAEPKAIGERPLGGRRERLALAEDSSDSSDGSEQSEADSADVAVPITQRHYSDSLYDAWVSGHDPRLDSLHIRLRTVEHTRTVRVPVAAKPKRWGIGVSAGYAATPRGLQPYIGVGVSYSLWEF